MMKATRYSPWPSSFLRFVAGSCLPDLSVRILLRLLFIRVAAHARLRRLAEVVGNADPHATNRNLVFAVLNVRRVTRFELEAEDVERIDDRDVQVRLLVEH